MCCRCSAMPAHLSLAEPNPTRACGYQYISCNDRILGTTVGFPSFLPDRVHHLADEENEGSDGGASLAKAGERFFLLAIDQATTISVSTCGSSSEMTTFRPRLTIYDRPPVNEDNYGSCPYSEPIHPNHANWHDSRPSEFGSGESDNNKFAQLAKHRIAD